MNFDWKANGFAEAPIPKLATGSERLYRAWGSNPKRKWGNTDLPGVCFSLDKAGSRWEAEMLYSVMEYQNPVRFLTEFTISKDAPFWFGRVDPGDPRALMGNVSGSQVFVERAYLVLVREGATTELRNDLGYNDVYTGKRPTSSS